MNEKRRNVSRLLRLLSRLVWSKIIAGVSFSHTVHRRATLIFFCATAGLLIHSPFRHQHNFSLFR